MDNIRSYNTTSSGSAERTSSSGAPSAAENVYAQAMQRLLEQQRMASMAELTNMNQAAATNMLAYSNPYMMASLTGMGAGFPGMLAAGMPGLAGVGGTDYQAAMAAMAGGFPGMAALYSSTAAMGYPSMPFTPSDYASALSAYAASSLAANSSLSTAASTLPSTADNGLNSPAISQSNRTLGVGLTRGSGSRQSTPHGRHSTSSQRTATPQRDPSAESSFHHSADSVSSPKKPRLTPGKREQVVSSKKQPSAETAAFYKGLSADEFDVNTHFKNSLGSLYENGLTTASKSASPLSTKPSSASNSTPAPSSVKQEQAGLDLTVKCRSTPPDSSDQAKLAYQAAEGHLARKSVIQTVMPAIPSTINSISHDHTAPVHSTKEQSSTNMYSFPSSYTKPNADSPANAGSVTDAHYDALPNLKRLSEQLKTGKSDAPNNVSVSNKSKNVLSLLKHNNEPSTEKARRKGRKSKAVADAADDAMVSQSQLTIESERDEIKRKLERDIDQPKITGRGQKAAKSTQQRRTNSTVRNKGRRKSNQTPKACEDGELNFPPPSDAAKPKRMYVRVKLAKDKPVDMSKLAIPFEYGWRRETRLRGISKNGKMIGEVFYYTPTDKRMRSYNDVLKYLDNLRTGSNKQSPDDEKETGSESKDSEGEKTESTTASVNQQNTDHSIEKLTASEMPTDSEKSADGEKSAGSEESTNSEKSTNNENAAGALSEATNGWLERSGSEVKRMAETSAVKRPPEWEALTKHHFSFNTRVKLGDFFEQKPGERYVLLTDEERDQRIESSNEKRNKQLDKLHKLKAKKEVLKETVRRVEQAKLDKEMETAQKAVQAKLKKQLEKAKSKAQQELVKQQRAAAMQLRRKQLQEEKDKERLEKQERNKHLLQERNRMQMERMIQKERKQEVKRRQLELARELKQPTEDLRLPNVKTLPTHNRIRGLKLPAQAFANVLQFHQFITNFHECLQLKQSVPTLNVIQQALLWDSKHSRLALSRILCHMLAFAVRDPGVHNSTKFVNEIGQRLSNLTIDECSFSEILRVFMLERNGAPTQLSRELETKPFSCLQPALRSEAMAWLCDELNTSQVVTEEIESNMDQVLNLRRDKWELEGKIRELKSTNIQEGGGKSNVRTKDTEHSDQSDNEDDNASEQLPGVSTPTPNRTPTSGTPTKQVSEERDGVEDKKLDKLIKQYSKVCKDVGTKSTTVRTFPNGMDRYRRYYWCLPSYKGLLVESCESSVHRAASDPTDCDLRLLDLSSAAEVETEPAAEQQAEEATACPAKAEQSSDVKMEVEADVKHTESAVIKPETSVAAVKDKADGVKTEKETAPPIILTPNTFKAAAAKAEAAQQPSPNGVRKPAHSITSWLCSTIDSIFTQQPNASPSHASSSLLSASEASLTTRPLSTSNSTSHIDLLDTSELDRTVASDRIQKYSPQLVANSLAFMNCMTSSEDHRELEALERLTAKAALLDQPKPLPMDVQKGWWILTEPEQIKSLASALHPRALREKLLNRSLIKNKEKLEKACSNESMCADVQFECDERDSEITSSSYQAPVCDETCSWVEQQCRELELTILDKVEDLEERVYQASIYTKSWADKKKNDATDLNLVVTPAAEVKEGEKRILDLVKEKLLLLEAGVERRYLKPPFIKSTKLQLADIVSKQATNGTAEDSENEECEDTKANEDHCSKGLLDWQRAVRGAVNLSQLYISLVKLEDCIAWEKSVMRVLCQVCRSDDKEDQLLLCDNCDKGYHTYCFKPKMLTIPSGDWYCWECKSKATGVAHCIRCGKPTGKMAQCHKCPQAIHLDCCSPPLSRVPRKHTCGHCLELSTQHLTKRRRRTKMKNYESNSESENEEEEEEQSTDDEETKVDLTDLSVCRELMKEIESHKDAEPFLEPVDTKAFPQYKKYIKQPMDLGKIADKLKSNQYESRTEFHDDMILIFDNCLLFNEDSSVVGKSGKVLRRLFQRRWKQLTSA